ncbi:MAG: pilus assembly protein [Selenomonas sp.]|uniref:TadE family protein n=1 Tax=Selenomonas sp. TaxID=2053611 RepID=UPI0025CBA629|nr:TadE family protein [Selenomonas sp.]MCR5757217.1 pilus assembly protein [Selenomonas sp.]
MKLMQKGQSMVEFAVIFPFFMFLIMSLAYFGLAFADYLQLNNIARSSAREALNYTNISAEDNKKKSNGQLNNELKSNYNKVKEKYSKQKLISDMYSWGDKSSKYDITYDKSNENVTVTIKAPLNKDTNSLPAIMDRLANSNVSDSGTFDINIKYTMYSGSTK